MFDYSFRGIAALKCPYGKSPIFCVDFAAICQIALKTRAFSAIGAKRHSFCLQFAV